MDYSVLINKFTKDFNKYSFDQLEGAIVSAILHEYGIKKVKNNLIAKLISDKVVSVDIWFSSNNIAPSLSFLEKFYELNINDLDKKINGTYYTPEHIVSYIIRETSNGSIGTFCDPACGSGAFLLEAARYLKEKTGFHFKKIFSNFIFGTDILPASKIHTEVLLSLLAIINNEDLPEYRFNIFTADSLTFSWTDVIPKFKGFDYVVGNPPYVRAKNLEKETRLNIKKWSTGSYANVDLYIPFFELGLFILRDTGKLGFITPSTYLTSLNAQKLRKYLVEGNHVEKIIDFNGWQVFKGATTYTAITILSRKKNKNILFSLVHKEENIKKLNTISFEKIDLKIFGEKEWRLLSSADVQNIMKIETIGSPLYKYVRRFVTGIATLNNDLFLVSETEDKKFLIKEYNNQVFRIEKEFTKTIIKPNKIKSLELLSKNKERIIYPYDISSGKAVLMEEVFIKRTFPNAYKYLLAIKPQLLQRDKGGRDYENWYAYGRTQGINDFGKKIIHPMMDNKTSFIIVNDENSLIYCGYAIFPKQEKDFSVLEKILNSKIMWYYIKKTSKNYSGGFKSFAKNYVKNFSIPDMNEQDRHKLLSFKNQDDIDKFLWEKYQLV